MSHASVESSPVAPPVENDRLSNQAMDRIRDALRGLRFGSVSIIVQDGVVVQVERTEKLRLHKTERER